jgi:hypothetical protein
MQPWCTGPVEILEHGLSLLSHDSDRNRRLAMIAIDNAVELAVKTYLGLPKRVTGLSLSRKEYGEISESFPRLLDALEQYALGKLDGIDLGEVEWYHRLRNQLYHQGNGLTVEKEKVQVYSELARLLFRNLFDVEVEGARTKTHEMLGSFLSEWVELERAIARLARQYRSDLTVTGGRLPAPMIAFQNLAATGTIRKSTARRIDFYRAIRNGLVHGEGDPGDLLSEEALTELGNLRKEIDQLV